MRTFFDLLSVLGALILGACTLDAPPAATPVAPAGAFGCAVIIATRGGTTQVQGTVTAFAPVTGSYVLRVQRGGTDIRQAGEFIALPGQAMTLGQAELSGEVPDAALRIVTDAGAVDCPVRR